MGLFLLLYLTGTENTYITEHPIAQESEGVSGNVITRHVIGANAIGQGCNTVTTWR